MNIFSKVTLQSLKKNKTRTIVTIIGIMLSTALICAVTTSFASGINYARENIIYYSGNWHGSSAGSSDNIDYDKFLEIEKDDEIEEAAFIQHLGYVKLNDDNSSKYQYLYIKGLSKNGMDMLSVKAKEGRLPETSKEIALSSVFESDYKIGDTITLDIGIRKSDDGVILNQYDPNFSYDVDGNYVENDETFEARETRTYTVVGKIEYGAVHDYYSAPGMTAITIADDAPTVGDYGTSVYFRMEKPKNVYSFMKKNDIHGNTNTELLATYGVSRVENVEQVMIGLFAIIIGLIMFGSIALIYNAFAISVSERAKQFGLLSSIGATKKQLRKSVIFEAFAVSIVGIPLGILLGISGIGVTFKFIGDKFAAFSESADIDMKLCVTPLAIVLACVIAFVTVLLSAYLPSRRAARMSAVEAIRQSNDIKASKKSVKTPKLIYKLFGLPGMLAHKYFKRSKKRYRATIVSLFMSIVLFISAAAFTENLVNSATNAYDINGYDIHLSMPVKKFTSISPDELLDRIQNDKNTKKSAYAFNRNYLVDIPKKYLSEEALSQYDELEMENQDGTVSVSVQTVFVNDDEFIELLDENNLSREEYMDPENPLAVAFDFVRLYNVTEEKYKYFNMISEKGECEYNFTFYKYTKGYYYDHCSDGMVKYRSEKDNADMIEIPEDKAKINVTAKSGKVIKEKPFYMDGGGSSITLIYPYSAFDSFYPKESSEMQFKDSSFIYYYVTSKNHEASAKDLTDICESYDLNANCYDYVKDVENVRNLILIIKVFAYGFIVLISLIAVANVFNTISTNVALRRREFAMLRSVGMTSKGIWKMLNFECIIYGVKALIYGLPVSGAICWLMNRSINEGFETDFIIPWKAAIIAVFSVFAVVFSTMLYAMNRIRKDNPIDALKNENI